MSILPKIYTLKDEAQTQLYEWFDEELFQRLKQALKKGELIIIPEDPRKYAGDKFVKNKPKNIVIQIQENKTGANILFYDVNQKIVMTKDEFLNQIKAEKYPDYSFKIVDGVEIPISKRDRFKFNNLG